MNNFKHLMSAITVVFFLLIGLASSNTKHMTFTKEAGQIPPDFNKFKDTLLVVGHSDDMGYNKYLKKNFEDDYTGKYKIIRPKEVKNYPIEKYRYIFDHSLNYSSKTTMTSTPITGGGNVTNGGSNTSYHTSSYASSDVFFITDRKIEKDYVTKSSAFFSKLMKAYIKALNEERQN